jgi:hypothetical protein
MIFGAGNDYSYNLSTHLPFSPLAVEGACLALMGAVLTLLPTNLAATRSCGSAILATSPRVPFVTAILYTQ